MAKFNWVPSKNANGDVIEGSVEAAFQAKLLGFITDADGNVKKYTSKSTGSEYRIANISFEDSNGDTQRQAARVHEGNFNKGMNVGETYNAIVTIAEGYDPFIVVSHLQGASFSATRSMFGVVEEETLVVDDRD